MAVLDICGVQSSKAAFDCVLFYGYSFLQELEAKLRKGEEQKREIAKRVEERKSVLDYLSLPPFPPLSLSPSFFPVPLSLTPLPPSLPLPSTFHPLIPIHAPRKQALQRLQQRCVAMRDECASLLQKLNSAISSCSHPHLLPEAAMKAHQNGCQLLMSVQSSLGQQLKSGTPDEKQVQLYTL